MGDIASCEMERGIMGYKALNFPWLEKGRGTTVKSEINLLIQWRSARSIPDMGTLPHEKRR